MRSPRARFSRASPRLEGVRSGSCRTALRLEHDHIDPLLSDSRRPCLQSATANDDDRCNRGRFDDLHGSWFWRFPGQNLMASRARSISHRGARGQRRELTRSAGGSSLWAPTGPVPHRPACCRIMEKALLAVAAGEKQVEKQTIVDPEAGDAVPDTTSTAACGGVLLPPTKHQTLSSCSRQSATTWRSTGRRSALGSPRGSIVVDDQRSGRRFHAYRARPPDRRIDPCGGPAPVVHRHRPRARSRQDSLPVR